MSERYPSDEADRFLIRMPEGMRSRIAELAKASGRSMNSQIVLMLQSALGGTEAGSEFARRFDRLALQVDALHKWMQRQPEEGGIHLDDDAEQMVVGQVRAPRPAHPARKKAK